MLACFQDVGKVFVAKLAFRISDTAGANAEESFLIRKPGMPSGPIAVLDLTVASARSILRTVVGWKLN